MSSLLTLKRHVFRHVGQFLRLAKACIYDGRRFYRESHLLGISPERDRLIGEILRYSHSLEKGLVLPEGRRPFGQDKIVHLKRLCASLPHDANLDWLNQYVAGVVESVEKVNLQNQPLNPLDALAGVHHLKKTDISLEAPASPSAYYALRRSIRTFSPEPVTPEKLEQATRIAQSSPSVCNRQAARVRFYSEDEAKKRILNLQVGNRGFGHQIPVVAVVSCDLRCFFNVGERNQAFVDGGLFAMMLALGFHAQSMGTCFLNWSAGIEQDRALRALLNIPEHEVVITLLAAGHLPDSLPVAESRRRPVSDVWLNKTDSAQ